MIKLNDFTKQWSLIESDVLKAVSEFGKSGWYILGDEVKAFEQKLVKFYPPNKYAVGCASGLDALEICLRALKIKKNTIVLTTPLSAFASTLAILNCGAIPAFVDVDESGLINLNLVREFFLQNKNATFLLPVHLFGHALNLVELEKLKKQFSLKIVEDCAQAIGAKSGSISVGSVGDVAATSFYPTKNLGCLGDGGALLTSDKTINTYSKTIRDYGQSTKYKHMVIGMNSRLDEIQAKIMSDVFMPKLHEYIIHRKKIADVYLRGIKNELIKIPPQPKNSNSVYHLFPILTKKRVSLMNYLKLNNIQSGIHYPILITDQPAMKNYPHIIFGKLSNASVFAKRELSLPINNTITKNEAYQIVEVINKWQG